MVSFTHSFFHLSFLGVVIPTVVLEFYFGSRATCAGSQGADHKKTKNHTFDCPCLWPCKLTRQNRPFCANTWAYHSFTHSFIHSFLCSCYSLSFSLCVALWAQMCLFPMWPWWSSGLEWHTKPWTRLCGGEKMKDKDPFHSTLVHSSRYTVYLVSSFLNQDVNIRKKKNNFQPVCMETSANAQVVFWAETTGWFFIYSTDGKLLHSIYSFGDFLF